MLISVLETCNEFAKLWICLGLEEETAEVDDEDEGEETQDDVHVRVASHYQDVVDQLDHEHDGGLHETDEECRNRALELPRVVQRELHVPEALLELCLHIDVEYETTNEPSNHNRGAHRLHLKVEELH